MRPPYDENGNIADYLNGAARISVTDDEGRFYAPDDAWIHGDEAFDRRERPIEAHYTARAAAHVRKQAIGA